MTRIYTADDVRRVLERTEDPEKRKKLKALILNMSDPDPLQVPDDQDAVGLRPDGETPHLRHEHPGLSVRSLRDRVTSRLRRLDGTRLGSHHKVR